MDKNLTVQEALEKLLAEKKSLLNDSNALMTELQEHVTPEHSMQLAFFRNALVDANIGEILMLADKSDEDTRDQAKAEAIALLQKHHMPEERAVLVVQTLTEAMGWYREPPPPPPPGSNNGRKSIPVIEDPQQETQVEEPESVKTSSDTVPESETSIQPPPSHLVWQKIVAWIIAGVILVSLGIMASIYNDRNLARKHNDSGLVYQKKEQYDKALEEFDQSIKLYPGYAEAYYNRGEVYYEKGEYDKALTDFHGTGLDIYENHKIEQRLCRSIFRPWRRLL